MTRCRCSERRRHYALVLQPDALPSGRSLVIGGLVAVVMLALAVAAIA